MRFVHNQGPPTPIGGALALLLLFCVFAGCATTQPGTGIDIRLTMFVEQDDSAALYRIERDGTIGFAGGYDARMRTITWTDTLRDNEIQLLESLLKNPFWRERHRSAGRLQAGDRRFTIDIRTTGLRNRIVIKVKPDESAPEEVLEMQQILRSAAARRLERDLDALPRGGPPADSR